MDTKLVLSATIVSEPSQKEAALNNAKAKIRMDGNTAIISVPLDELVFYDSVEPDHGKHRWILMDIDTGLTSDNWSQGLLFNGIDINVTDEDRSMCENKEGHFVFCVPAEAFIRKNRVYTLELSKEGYGTASLDITVENTSEFKPNVFILGRELILKAEPRAEVPAFNNSVSSIVQEGDVFTITTPLNQLKQVTSVVNPQFGSHSWMWLGLDIGLRGEDWCGSEENGDILELNGKPALDRYTHVLGEGINGHITIYPQVDGVANEPKTFTISRPGYKSVSFTLKVIDSSN